MVTSLGPLDPVRPGGKSAVSGVKAATRTTEAPVTARDEAARQKSGANADGQAADDQAGGPRPSPADKAAAPATKPSATSRPQPDAKK